MPYHVVDPLPETTREGIMGILGGVWSMCHWLESRFERDPGLVLIYLQGRDAPPHMVRKGSKEVWLMSLDATPFARLQIHTYIIRHDILALHTISASGIILFLCMKHEFRGRSGGLFSVQRWLASRVPSCRFLLQHMMKGLAINSECDVKCAMDEFENIKHG